MVGSNDTEYALLTERAAALRKNWGWLMALGVCLLALGIIALLGDLGFLGALSIVFFGWILVAAGIVEAIQAFRHRASGYLLVHTLSAILAIVVGVILLRNPSTAADVVTFVMAIYFVVAGVFRIIVSLAERGPGWGWLLFSGIITLVLGILVWNHWPNASLWIIGLFIAVELIVMGWTQIMLAMVVRTLPAPAR